MIGATLARIQIKKISPGLWKTVIALVALRLIILPIIGVSVTLGFHKGNWYAGDDLLWFVSVLEYCLPSAMVFNIFNFQLLRSNVKRIFANRLFSNFFNCSVYHFNFCPPFYCYFHSESAIEILGNK